MFINPQEATFTEEAEILEHHNSVDPIVKLANGRYYALTPLNQCAHFWIESGAQKRCEKWGNSREIYCTEHLNYIKERETRRSKVTLENLDIFENLFED